ncbi:cell surface protein [Lactiplantibacillus nangangensis]|uniref:Cell surface protein n=1 Tax=Lactiplantibacillus nangangensis TaxID=2559917 RepID=A0ABW1SHY6_9LACO|nr:cell surface protein [Lactiplantibacillus nangangensis]
MQFKKATLLAVLGLTLLSGCGQSSTTAPKTVVKHNISYVDKQTQSDKDAWAAAKAESRANAESAKKLHDQSSTLAKAANEASSQSSELTSSRESSQAAASSQAASASKAAASQTVAASKAASSSAKAAEDAASTQTSSANSTSTNRANNFSGDTDTAQTGRIVGNSRSKIYHVETGHNYHMAGKNAVYFQTEAAAQAAGYRKSMR